MYHLLRYFCPRPHQILQLGIITQYWHNFYILAPQNGYVSGDIDGFIDFYFLKTIEKINVADLSQNSDWTSIPFSEQ